MKMDKHYDKEIYGIMCIREDNMSSGGSIAFELKFRSFGESEKAQLKEKLDKTDNLGSCSFKILRAYCSPSSTKIFCANWDETRTFVWANETMDYVIGLLS
jgi:hypothetical protein